MQFAEQLSSPSSSSSPHVEHSMMPKLPSFDSVFVSASPTTCTLAVFFLSKGVRPLFTNSHAASPCQCPVLLQSLQVLLAFFSLAYHPWQLSGWLSPWQMLPRHPLSTQRMLCPEDSSVGFLTVARYTRCKLNKITAFCSLA